MRLSNYITEVKLKNASKLIGLKGLPSSQEDRNSVLDAVFPWKTKGVGKSWEIQGRKGDYTFVVYDTKNASFDKAFTKKRKLEIK